MQLQTLVCGAYFCIFLWAFYDVHFLEIFNTFLGYLHRISRINIPNSTFPEFFTNQTIPYLKMEDWGKGTNFQPQCALGWEVFRKCCCISLGRSQNVHTYPMMILSQKNGGSLLWKIVPPGGWSLCSNFTKKCMGICLKIKFAIISTVLVRFWRSKCQIPLIWGRGIDFWCQK